MQIRPKVQLVSWLVVPRYIVTTQGRMWATIRTWALVQGFAAEQTGKRQPESLLREGDCRRRRMFPNLCFRICFCLPMPATGSLFCRNSWVVEPVGFAWIGLLLGRIRVMTLPPPGNTTCPRTDARIPLHLNWWIIWQIDIQLQSDLMYIGINLM